MGGTDRLATAGVDAPAPTRTAEPLSPQARTSVAGWAASVCAGAQALQDALATAADGVDASTLTLAERQARSARLGVAWLAALADWRGVIESISPPDDVRDFHAALRAEVDLAEGALVAAVAAIAAATTATEIEASNAAVGIAQAEANALAMAATAALPAEAVAALRGVTRCGGIVA